MCKYVTCLKVTNVTAERGMQTIRHFFWTVAKVEATAVAIANLSRRSVEGNTLASVNTPWVLCRVSGVPGCFLLWSSTLLHAFHCPCSTGERLANCKPFYSCKDIRIGVTWTLIGTLVQQTDTVSNRCYECQIRPPLSPMASFTLYIFAICGRYDNELIFSKSS